MRINLHVASDGVAGLAYLRRMGEHANAPRADLILLDLNMLRIQRSGNAGLIVAECGNAVVQDTLGHRTHFGCLQQIFLAKDAEHRRQVGSLTLGK